MNESSAVVRQIKGEFAVVEMDSMPSACGRCEEQGRCGKSLLTEGGKPRLYLIRNTVGAQVGDDVLVATPDGAVLKAALLSYFMPIVVGLVGAAVGVQWWGEGSGSIGGFVLGLAVGFGLLRYSNRRAANGREPLLSMRLKRHVVSFEKDDKK